MHLLRRIYTKSLALIVSLNMALSPVATHAHEQHREVFDAALGENSDFISAIISALHTQPIVLQHTVGHDLQVLGETLGIMPTLVIISNSCPVPDSFDAYFNIFDATCPLERLNARP